MTDQRLEQLVGNLLRAGVALAAAVVAFGGIWFLWTGGRAPANYHRFHAGPRSLHALTTLPPPQAVILAGLLILVATPVARVIFSLTAFALERDATYVGITLLVLATLVYSLGTAWW
jgi:uncharacterized membrane protein